MCARACGSRVRIGFGTSDRPCDEVVSRLLCIPRAVSRQRWTWCAALGGRDRESPSADRAPSSVTERAEPEVPIPHVRGSRASARYVNRPKNRVRCAVYSLGQTKGGPRRVVSVRFITERAARALTSTAAQTRVKSLPPGLGSCVFAAALFTPGARRGDGRSAPGPRTIIGTIARTPAAHDPDPRETRARPADRDAPATGGAAERHVGVQRRGVRHATPCHARALRSAGGPALPRSAGRARARAVPSRRRTLLWCVRVR